MARSKAVLGDARRDKRAAWMLDRIVSCGSLVLREIGGTRSGEMGAHRLLSSEDVDPDALLLPHVARTVEACRSRRIVAAQDTTEINFDRFRQPVAGLGPTGNTGIRGFFMHPVVAVDADDEALLGVVGARMEVREVPAAGKRRKAAGPPLLWRLVTTLPVAGLAQAQDVVRLYRLRWRIVPEARLRHDEEVFRVLKSDGLDIEDSQLETAGRLLNLAALGLVAAARIIQLVDARDGSSRPATDVIEAQDIDAAAAISATLEGATERQKNHHPPGSLAWLAWIAARLGGWNCYYKPPGPKTMARGLDRLLERIEGFRAGNQRRNV